MAELSPKRRTRTEEMNLRGLRQKDIAIQLGISQGTVSKTLKRIRNDDFEGDLKSKTRSGRPLNISLKTDRRIRRIVQNDPTISSVDFVSQLNLSTKVSLSF